MVPGPYVIFKPKLVSMKKGWAGMVGQARLSSCYELKFINKDREKNLRYLV